MKVMEVSSPLMGPEVMSFPSTRRVAVLKAKGFPLSGAEGFGGAGNVGEGGETGIDGFVRFGGPAPEGEGIISARDHLDGPVTGMFAILGRSAASNVTLVPRRIGFLDPVVGSHGDHGVVLVSQIDLGGQGEGGLQFGPPRVIEGAHGFHLVRVGFSDIVFLTRIGIDVVEFDAVIQAPPLGHDCRLAPLDGIAHTL